MLGWRRCEMLNLTAANEKAFLNDLAKALDKKFKRVAFDQVLTIRALLEDIMRKSPQWSGNYARNWYAFFEKNGDPLYNDIAQKESVRFIPGDKSRAFDTANIRKLGDITDADVKRAFSSDDEEISQKSIYSSKVVNGYLQVSFEPIIIHNITEYRENIETDTSDEGKSPYIRKINKINGQVYNLSDTLSRYKSLRKLRWGSGKVLEE